MTTPLTATYVRTMKEGVDYRHVLLRVTTSTPGEVRHVLAVAAIPGAHPTEYEGAQVHFYATDETGTKTIWQDRLRGSREGDMDIPAALAAEGYQVQGWCDDVADEYVASIEGTVRERISRSTFCPEQGVEAINLLRKLRERVRLAEMRGYHRGVAVAQALWEKKQQALYDLNATETELRGLRNRNIG
jgi:hypothetical protein